jgi:hypothetical protein
MEVGMLVVFVGDGTEGPAGVTVFYCQKLPFKKTLKLFS